MPGWEACLHSHSAHHDREAEHEHSGAHSSGFTLPGAKKEYAPDLRLEPTHLDVSLVFYLHSENPDESLRVEAQVRTTVRANAAGATSLTLNGVGFLDVRVKEEAEVTHRYDGEKLSLAWNKPFALHEERVLTVTYTIYRPLSGMFLSVPDKAYPKRAVYAVTDEESERARYWLLSVDYPAVRTTLAFHITAHGSFSTVANGLLQSTEEAPNGMKIWHWHCEHRVPSYLVCLGVAAWDIVQATAASPVPISYYALPGFGPIAAQSFEATPRIMEWMVKKFGVPFPFKAYRILTCHGIGGAMENITLTTFDQKFLNDPKSATEWQDTTDEVNVHEMAHSYFGDSVVIRHFEHAWLKESWANYTEALYIEDHRTRADFEYDMWNSANRYFSECERYMRPIVTRTYNNSFQLFDMHLYPGGAWRLHMLRNRLGDALFFSAVKLYLQEYMGKLAETDDFRKVLERESGQSLTRFFEEFFYQPNYPRLAASISYSLESGQLCIAVRQNRPHGEEPFEISLEVSVVDRNGGKYSGVLHWSASKEASLTLKLAAPPLVVEFDPDTKLLFSMEWSPGEDILVGTAQKAGSVISRISALQTLIKKGSASAIEQALAVALKEPHWGVRVQAARALARQGSARALKALAKLLTNERDPHALHQIASACCTKDSAIEEALLALLARPDLPYRAHARALEALGAQENNSHLPLLLQASQDAGWQGIVRLGAVQGLGYLGQHETLAARVPYGGEIEEMIRAEVITAYREALLAGGSSQAVRKGIELIAAAMRAHADNCLGRVTVNAVVACVQALVALRATGYIGAMSAMKQSLGFQYHARIEAELIKLRKSTDDGVTQLTKRIADLESRISQLEDKK